MTNKKYLWTLTVICLLLYNNAHAQLALDSEHLSRANYFLDKTRNCSGALGELKFISDSGKKTEAYFLTMGEAQDCSANTEQAIYYYKKYLEKNPGADSIVKRVAELTDKKNKRADVAQQEQKAKDIYKALKNGYGHLCISDRDFIWGLNYNLFTGGNKFPYKNSIGAFNTYERLVANNHLTFDFSGQISYMFSGQKNWFGKALNIPDSLITHVPGSISASIDLSLSYVLLNKHALAVTLGPTVGCMLLLMPGVDIYDNSYSNTYSAPLIFSPALGIRSDVYIGRHMYAALSYTYITKSTYSNSINNYTTTTTPVNGNSLSVSVAIRGFGAPRYYHNYDPSYGHF